MAIDPPLSLATGYCVVRTLFRLIMLTKLGHSPGISLRNGNDWDDLGAQAIPGRNSNVALTYASLIVRSEQFSTAGRSVKTGLVGISSVICASD